MGVAIEKCKELSKFVSCIVKQKRLGVAIEKTFSLSVSSDQNPRMGCRRILNFCMGSLVTKIGGFQ